MVVFELFGLAEQAAVVATEHHNVTLSDVSCRSCHHRLRGVCFLLPGVRAWAIRPVVRQKLNA